jgi:uncharacterized protein (TIGR04222 family)
MNPFDLPGPAFLQLYAAVFAVGLALAIFLRRLLRVPKPDPFQDPPALDPYEAAYLAGGPRRAINAALARLVQDGALGVEAGTGKLVRQGDLPAGAYPLERHLYPSSPADPELTVKELGGRAERQLEKIATRLERQGLLVAGAQAWRARLLPLAVMLGVAFFGAGKLLVGAARHKPVGFLVLACIVTGLVALLGFARRVHRSRRGDGVLAQLQSEHVALRETARTRPGDLPSADLSLAVGLFGLGLLATGPLSPLHTLLRPPGSTGGGGGGGCGSGGCGGGGGGCGGGGGGGGCGGGGCGGCGG